MSGPLGGIFFDSHCRPVSLSWKTAVFIGATLMQVQVVFQYRAYQSPRNAMIISKMALNEQFTRLLIQRTHAHCFKCANFVVLWISHYICVATYCSVRHSSPQKTAHTARAVTTHKAAGTAVHWSSYQL